MNKISFRLADRPQERTILIAICKKYSVNFRYNDETGFAVVDCPDRAISSKITILFGNIVHYAYVALSKIQIDNKYSSVNIRTINTEFMKTFSDYVCSLLTGDTILSHVSTEIERAGLVAATEMADEKWLTN